MFCLLFNILSLLNSTPLGDLISSPIYFVYGLANNINECVAARFTFNWRSVADEWIQWLAYLNMDWAVFIYIYKASLKWIYVDGVTINIRSTSCIFTGKHTFLWFLFTTHSYRFTQKIRISKIDNAKTNITEKTIFVITSKQVEEEEEERRER